VHVAWWVAAVLLVVAGVAGTVFPALPGAPLVFAGLLLAAWVDGFQHVGGGTISILVVLTLLSLAVDFVATSLGAKRVGASATAVTGALIGTVVGLFFGVAGLLLGPFVGAVLGELLARRDLAQAGRAGVGTWIGLVLGTAAKLALACAMVGVFLAAYLL
jgi:uncharacterized protein YqgC (DUF456 family)